MPFALDSDPSQAEISDAINYLLNNFSLGSAIYPDTGQILGPGGQVIGYIYKYIAVKYADDQFGTGFSNSPTNKAYYGLNNTNNASESSNPADYIWYQASGGFGVTKFLWYITTGGRQIQFAVSPTAPDTGWLVDPGSSIDLDVVTSGTTPIIAESFVPYFAPSTLQVPRTGNPLTPSFTGVVARMYATNAGTIVPFTDAQTDTNVAFVNNSWRIGNSATTGNGDISYTNITVGNPTDGGDYAQWPAPTAMSASPAYITVPVRYKNSTGVVSQAGIATIQYVFSDPGAAGQNSPYIDISGYTGFVVNSGGGFTPANATLSAITTAITSPTYSWAITNATPTSSTNSTVVITPNSNASSVEVTLTVNGSNLLSPLSKTISMPVTFNGAPGQAGQNGVMSAFPTIYIWTGSSSTPTRPTTTSTYTWATGAYTPPSGWSTTAPSNTTAGNYLWSITVPLNVSATTVTSTLDWTNTSYPIRCIAYNGENGGAGATGASGSSTFVVTRSANDSSPPTNAEVNAVIGRNPVAGDIVTVSYNNANNAVVYRYTNTWITQATYITGSLIVENTITASKFVAGIIWTQNLQVGSSPTISGTTMTGSGAVINSNGTFALGNSSTNLTFDGNNLSLNGSLINYGNISSSAVGQIIASFNLIPFLTPGVTTFTVPANVYKLKVTCVGGGGGGGGSTIENGFETGGLFGAAGGTTVQIVSVTPGSVYTVTVGDGGAGGLYNGNGAAGGTTSFVGTNINLIANGGAGGTPARSGTTFVIGGTSSGGFINYKGSDSTPYSSGTAALIGLSVSANVDASPNSGAGGGRAYAVSGATGKKGGSGLVFVEY